MTPSTHPPPVRLGPYELLQRIATGGMAEVYLARRAGPHGFQKVVAVKRILPQLAMDPDFVAMYVDGTTAARLVRAAASRGEEVPLDAALYIGLSILRGLDYAHSARDDEGRPL